MSDLLGQHQLEFQVLKLLMWAIEHPIVSFIAFIVIAVVLGKIVKLIDRFIEIAGLSILKVPVKLIRVLIGWIFQVFSKIFDFLFQRIFLKGNEENQTLPIILDPPINESLEQQKHQRLLEISSRLEAIREEQTELLQEAANLLTPPNEVRESVKSGK
ncbi:MAG: hypothetical protein KME17_17020 [Cyanosarcina radialis HA8281-LM2]|jgi:hypothetical protein|nr:hypothetical protein [Cyanosarcina radialis HA8281-LM2]